MRKNIIVIVLLLTAPATRAQILNPVKWLCYAKRVSDKTYEMHFRALIARPWHVYSGVQPKEAIAQPTEIKFTKNPVVALSGKIKESGKKETYKDAQAGIVQYQYADSVDFVQVVELKAKVTTAVSGTITYQVCNDEMCLPPKTIPFSITAGDK